MVPRLRQQPAMSVLTTYTRLKLQKAWLWDFPRRQSHNSTTMSITTLDLHLTPSTPMARHSHIPHTLHMTPILRTRPLSRHIHRIEKMKEASWERLLEVL